MRTVIRLAVMGILVISCTEDVFGPRSSAESDPYVCVRTSPDTVFLLNPDSLHLVVGSADVAYLEWGVSDGCEFTPLPGAEISWTVRDTAIVSDTLPGWETPEAPYRQIIPRASGRTLLVVEARGSVDSMSVSVPDTSAMGLVNFVAAAGTLSCAVTESDDALCWGGASSVLGEWGSDPAIGTCFGSPCSPMPVPQAAGVRSIYAGGTHACVLDAFGSASCWGENYALQLGRTNPEVTYDPEPISAALSFASLTLGWSHTCGVALDGKGYCWGDPVGGKLGGNHRGGPVATPVMVDEELLWSSLDARPESTCGTTDSGRLYCWGILRTTGPPPAGAEICQLAQGKGGPVSVPCSFVPLRMALSNVPGADSLFAQASGTCALTTMGSVYCYTDARAAYTYMSGFGPFASLTSGGAHACGLTAGGDALCWGDNSSGQIGDGGTGLRGSPSLVSGGHLWTQIAAGQNHTCGLTMGEVWCWGGAGVGQTGTSILSAARTPLKVHGQD